LLFAIVQFLFSGFLLVRHSLALAFASAAVVLGPLSAQGQSRAVPDASIATDIHQSLDVQLNLRAEFTFDFEAVSNNSTDLRELVVVPVLNLGIEFDTRFFQDVTCPAPADAVDVGESNLTPLVPREVYACYSRHTVVKWGLALSLFKLGVLLVDDVQLSFSPYDFAVCAALFQGCSNFHRFS
jgi:hypothetical protein